MVGTEPAQRGAETRPITRPTTLVRGSLSKPSRTALSSAAPRRCRASRSGCSQAARRVRPAKTRDRPARVRVGPRRARRLSSDPVLAEEDHHEQRLSATQKGNDVKRALLCLRAHVSILALVDLVNGLRRDTRHRHCRHCLGSGVSQSTVRGCGDSFAWAQSEPRTAPNTSYGLHAKKGCTEAEASASPRAFAGAALRPNALRGK